MFVNNGGLRYRLSTLQKNADHSIMLKAKSYPYYKKAFPLLACVCLLAPTGVTANPTPLAVHFFPDEDPELTLAHHAIENPEQTMQMVIFTADEQQIESSSNDYTDEQGFTFTYSLDSHYQQDTVKWSVASPTGRPDTLTEMQWDNLSMLGAQLGFKMSMPYHIVFKGDAAYAWALSGDSRQIFYAGDGKTQAFSDIRGNPNQSYTWHGSLALGYAFDFGTASENPVSFNFTPLAGYAWREQNLKSNDGKQKIASFNPVDPKTLDQENSYSTRWYGPWLGADITLQAFKKHQLFSSFQHHWANYKAEGHWRQSPELQQPKSFEHEANATGIVASAGYRYITDNMWGVSVSVDYQKWETEGGSETLYTINDTTFKSKLNEVDWKSLGVNLGLNMKF